MKKRELNWWQTLICALAVSVYICVLQVVLFGGSLAGYFAQPVLFILNGFPVVCAVLICWFLCGNVFYGGAFCSLLFLGLSTANLIKIEGREDPLAASDFLLLREAADAVMDYSLNMHWGIIALIVFSAVLLVILGIYVKSRKIDWKIRAAGVLVLVFGFLLAFRLVYSSVRINVHLKKTEAYNAPQVYRDLGFNYCFLFDYDLSPLDEPEGFSKAEIEKLEYPAPGISPEFKPNVIIVMGEAFTDMADEDCFLYSEEDSPLADYHAACAMDNTINGHIVVSNYGAGTANTEFDVMTGMQTNMLGEGSSAFQKVYKKTKNLGSVFNDLGYSSFFMHPGEKWFYSRNSVYQYFGIPDQTFVDAFSEDDILGTHVSDEAFLRKLRELMLSHQSPMFAYAVTIQNHQAYWYGKYKGLEMPHAPVDRELTPAAQEGLDTYMKGAADTAAMVKGLCEFVDTLDYPTMIVFFGDHRPSIGNAPKELGLYQDVSDPWTFAAPFLIKANFELDEEKLDLPSDSTITDSYMGSVIMELCGFEGADAYFDMLSAQRRELPVILGSDADLSLMKKWTYYRLKY